MYKYEIEGGNKLYGSVKVKGAKNASLPILVATLLTKGETRLRNVAFVEDVKSMILILEDIGCKVNYENEDIIIDTTNINKVEVCEILTNKLRASSYLMGGLLARCNEVSITQPGGCDIGIRPIDLHLKSFKKMGSEINNSYGKLNLKCDKLNPIDIYLDFPSVGATVNTILAATLSEGTTYIRNAAREPEIVDLSKFINKCGGNIIGAGTSVIIIQGVKKLKSGITYDIISDRIVASTLLIATSIAGGEIEIDGLDYDTIQSISETLKEIGCYISKSKDKLLLASSGQLKSVRKIDTSPFPGFPTDVQPQLTALLSTCNGTSIINERIFESRFNYIEYLNKMGADILVEGRTIIINGVKKLYGTQVQSKDLRGGAALVLAGLNAKGRTIISGVEHINRGYINFDVQLNELGAKIKRV